MEEGARAWPAQRGRRREIAHEGAGEVVETLKLILRALARLAAAVPALLPRARVPRRSPRLLRRRGQG